MGWEEAQDYVLVINLPFIGALGQANLNADEVVECAYEYGIEIPYENLPTQPGEIVAGEDYQIEWPRETV